MPHRLDVAEAVPDVGVLGRDPQGHLLAAAADHDRDPPLRRRVEPFPARLDHRQRRVEVAQAARSRPELVAVLVVVALEPARADPEDEPPAGDVVDRARHVGEQVRVAVRVAGDERAELDPLGHLGHRREHRPALEVLPVGIAEERVEVVPVEELVDAELLGFDPGRPHLRVLAVLRKGVEGDANGHAPTLRF